MGTTEVICFGFMMSMIPGLLLIYAANYCLKRGQNVGAALAGAIAVAVVGLSILSAQQGMEGGRTAAQLSLFGGIAAAVIILFVFRKSALQVVCPGCGSAKVTVRTTKVDKETDKEIPLLQVGVILFGVGGFGLILILGGIAFFVPESGSSSVDVVVTFAGIELSDALVGLLLTLGGLGLVGSSAATVREYLSRESVRTYTCLGCRKQWREGAPVEVEAAAAD